MAAKTARQAFQRLLRAALLHVPDQTEPSARAMRTALTREATDDGDALDLREVLDEELARLERTRADRRQDPNGPTTQTVRNLQQDPIAVMIQRGAIDKGDEGTIEVLRDLQYKMRQGLVPGGGGAVERVDGGPNTYVPAVERLSDRQDAIRRLVYDPWVAAHSKNITVGKRKRVVHLTPFGLVTMVIDGETTIRNLEEAHHIGRPQSGGSVLSKEFRTAIRDFAARLGKAEAEGAVPRRRS